MAKGNTALQKQRRQQRQQTLPRLDCPCGVTLLQTDANIYAHRKTTKHQDWEQTETGKQVLADIQMKKSSWITALKEWNEGKPAWCIPRKGTDLHKEVLALKVNHTLPVTFHEDKTDTIDVPTYTPPKPVVAPPKRRVVKATLPKEPTKTRMEEIDEQIKEEAKTGIYSVDYDLGWKPNTTEPVYSGATRSSQARDYKWILSLQSVPEHLDVNKLTEFIKTDKDKFRLELAASLLTKIPSWKPENTYTSVGENYNTKQKLGGVEPDVLKALADYQEFADEVNKVRGTPIRNITIQSKFYQDGRRTLTAEWTITKTYGRYTKTFPYFVREYQLTPEFKFIGGETIESIKEYIRRNENVVVEKAAKQERKKAADLRIPIQEKLDENIRQIADVRLTIRQLVGKANPYTAAYNAIVDTREYKALSKREAELEKESRKLYDALKVAEKQMKTARDTTEEGQKLLALRKEKKTLDAELQAKLRDYRKANSKSPPSNLFQSYTDRLVDIDTEIKALMKELRTK